MEKEKNHNRARWHVCVRPRQAELDGHGRAVLADVRQFGMPHIEGILFSKIYMLEGAISDQQVRLLAETLIADPVAETYEMGPGFGTRRHHHPAVEVHPLPGVMNPVAASAKTACDRLLAAHFGPGVDIHAIQTGRCYQVVGSKTAEELETIARRVLANDCIETWYIQGHGRDDVIPESFPQPPHRPFELKTVPLRALDADRLAKLSREGHLFLSVDEMRAIQKHYESLGRDPTDLELETLAQTWSEHCVHKTLKSPFEYTGEDFGRPGKTKAKFDNLLGDTIAAATRKLDRPWCLSVFVDNAGVIAFDDDFGIAFKAETHNHPSAIEPYGGSATGIGGCIRDIMGCGLGAKPIASTDVFCLAPPDFDTSKLPRDVLHPRRVLKGVVSGVRDYGNRMGIPTVNGAMYFDERYLANPLVFCGCIGLIPRDKIAKQPIPGDLIVVAGGRTGRDGIHGATFSSAELSDGAADEFSHAVQIGNAIEEKKLLDAQLLARDHARGCLYSAVTDCGAGGLSSAVGEMGETLGAVVDLEHVPLKYDGLRYDEIWISEAQERMVFAVHPEFLDDLLGVFQDEDVEATVIGRFTDDKVLRVRFDGVTVGELDLAFLHHGIPKTTLVATWNPSPLATNHEFEGAAADAFRSTADLLAALGAWNVASREWVIRQYDHEVQGRSVVKPLTGPHAGPSDAAVLRPLFDKPRGIAIGCGLCPDRGDVDPYDMAIAAVDEALRNVICVGANPEQTAILDNFCWPKVDSPESLGALVRACRGAHDAAVAYGLPFISGKDSLNNEFAMSADEAARLGLPERIAIPPTLLISAVGVVEDLECCATMDFKSEGHAIVVACSPFEVTGLESAFSLHRRVANLVKSGQVLSAHDISDGGLAVTLAEMCIASGLGAEVDVLAELFPYSMFAALTTAYCLEMSCEDADRAGLVRIGTVSAKPRLVIRRDSGIMVDASVAELSHAWREPLAHGGGRRDG